MRAWYRIQCKADETVAELSIFDEIGPSFFNDDAVTAKQFIADVRALPETVKTIRVHVNSPGGSVFEAVAIANALRTESREHKRTIEMRIEGLAASAATIVTSAGDSIAIADNALLMIHNPLAIVLGPAKDMREMADLLDKVRDSIVATYRWVSHLSVKAISDLMDATTWMNAEEAVKNGFATEVIEGAAVTARFNPAAIDRLGAVPEPIKARLAEWTAADFLGEITWTPSNDSNHFTITTTDNTAGYVPKPIKADARFVLTACEGLSPKLAALLLDLTEADVTARVAHAKEVAALCETAKLPELADGYALAHTPIATVKAHLTVVTAKLDRVEIDTRHNGDEGKKPAGRLNAAAIYERRRTPQLALGTGR
jgi:ATP-dependent protease ClpP protease subunit